MGRSCKGRCQMLKAETVPNSQRYDMGHKRCSVCALFFAIADIRCPCCKVVLRTKPRGKKRNP